MSNAFDAHLSAESLTATERVLFRRGIVRNTGVFFVVFAVLLVLLGLFVYIQVSSKLFDNVDAQLTEATQRAGAEAWITRVSPEDDAENDAGTISSRKDYGGVDKSEELLGEGESLADDGSLEVSEGLAEAILTSREREAGLDSQLTFVIRGKEGEALSTISANESLPDYLQQLPFDCSVLDKPLLQNFQGHWLRSIAVSLGNEAELGGYLQVISNVDSEMSILNSFTATMTVAFCCALLAAAGLSYALSRRAMRPVVRAWRQQTAFTQDASHELRSPLAVIKAVQENLLAHPHDRIIDHFEEISTTVDEADRLAQLSQNLLDISSLDMGRTALNVTSFDFDELIGSLSAFYAEYAASLDKTFTVELRSGVDVIADEQSIKQLFAIIVDNAFKYTGENDSIVVSTSATAKEVRLVVRDTGSGMTQEEAEHACERFYRSRDARAQTGGSGLGLALAKRIVLAHQGSIQLLPCCEGLQVVVTIPRDFSRR